MITCPICAQKVSETTINQHIDAGCPSPSNSQSNNRANIAPIFNLKSSQTPEKRPAEQHPDVPPTKRAKETVTPLAEVLRPKTLDDFVGHRDLVEFLTQGLGTSSFILWGPSGCGKTTLAKLIGAQSNAIFKELSATVAGINEVKAVVEAAKAAKVAGRRTILFLDEIHRFNKGQQDIFLPFLERGYIQLIGSTTENPSFKLVGALLSRCRVFSLQRLQDDDIRAILDAGLTRVSSPVKLTEKLFKTIVALSAGDARVAISLLEVVIKVPSEFGEEKLLALLRQSVATSYDPAEDHYDMISALHKSVRGSQPDAALYWLARMLAGGEDPTFICRRMIVAASEDIGLADNQALPLAVATLQACQNIGMPECRINLAHLVAYLSEAPKSTRSYEAYKRAEAAVSKDPSLPVPLTMRNAPTSLMKELGYGRNYKYNPEYQHPVDNQYLPSELEDAVFLEKAGQITGTWDEEALVEWETRSNGGEPWQGRK
ncbi:DNA polymerase III, clamp loader complex, gamma/delta/delta subunit [Roridomyces roridus]|uniref:DNA polymerase III, clamp loader complex, gamma/delta/delta subunit n=1 Tax=Roridomyces roridus TaxID=1738132 RepID=A0AAD7CFG4_9AGAR|nr:DNA polymerase III, clamp loader complex, gamma/delta/delta subunit [Roridomyces roridus]